MGPPHVAFGGAPEDAVETAEELLQRTWRPPAILRLQEQRGERGTQRERIERGKDHRDRNGDGELLIEPSGDAGDEGRGNEYRGEHQRDADDGRGNFLHGFQRGVSRR